MFRTGLFWCWVALIISFLIPVPIRTGPDAQPAPAGAEPMAEEPPDTAPAENPGPVEEQAVRQVAAASLPLRDGPSQFHREIATLRKGERVIVLYAYDQVWLKVRAPGRGLNGYVKRGTLGPAAAD